MRKLTVILPNSNDETIYLTSEQHQYPVSIQQHSPHSPHSHHSQQQSPLSSTSLVQHSPLSSTSLVQHSPLSTTSLVQHSPLSTTSLVQPILKSEPVDPTRMSESVTNLDSPHQQGLDMAYSNPVQHAWNMSTDQAYYNSHSQVI